MRRLLIRGVVALATVLVPALAWAGNQEVADQIAGNLRSNGPWTGCNINVKCQEGTVWLQGNVAQQDQLNRALKTVFQTPGVTRVVNQLAVTSGDASAQPAPRERPPTARSPRAVAPW